MKLSHIARTIGAELVGEDEDITGVAALEEAVPGQLSIYDGPRYTHALRATRASAVILPTPREDVRATQLIHPSPMLALCDVLPLFHPPSRPGPGVHPSAVVSTRATLEDSVSVGPRAVIEPGARVGSGTVIEAGCYVGPGVRIGGDTWLKPNVTVLEAVSIGHRVTIHAGTVIGADGYGYRWDGRRHRKIPQVGGVHIEDDVEIGANCTIDRATLGRTVIGAGTRLDDQVHVGHNVRIGRHCLIIAQVGIAGSASIGDRVTVAGQTGVADHSIIGDGAVVVARSGVHGRVAAGAVVAGSPIMPHPLWRKVSVAMRRLPELVRTVRRLEGEIQTLRNSARKAFEDTERVETTGAKQDTPAT